MLCKILSGIFKRRWMKGERVSLSYLWLRNTQQVQPQSVLLVRPENIGPQMLLKVPVRVFNKLKLPCHCHSYYLCTLFMLPMIFRLGVVWFAPSSVVWWDTSAE